MVNQVRFCWLLKPHRRIRGLLGAMVITVVGLGGFPWPAQANIFDFLFGGRQSRDGRPPNRKRGGAVRTGRLPGGSNTAIPYIITPRNTFQLSDRFQIQWNSVPNTETYDVFLWQWADANGGRQRVVWQTTTSETAITYPGDPALPPENFYSIEVITDQGVSSDQDAGCSISGFAVLFSDSRRQLQHALRALDTREMTAAEQALAEAEIYLKYQMPDAAIAAIAAQASTNPDPTLELALGQLYSYAGLNAPAIAHYETALALATADNDLLWQAIATEGLGEINVTLNNLDRAFTQLQQSAYLYALEGATIQATQANERLNTLEAAQTLGIQPSLPLGDCGDGATTS